MFTLSLHLIIDENGKDADGNFLEILLKIFLVQIFTLLAISLVLLKFFIESLILDVWWESKSACDSICVCFFEFIDNTKALYISN